MPVTHGDNAGGRAGSNYELFRTLGAAAIIARDGVPTARCELAVRCGAKRRSKRALPVSCRRSVRDNVHRDSLPTETTLREKALRDSVTRALRTRAAIMRRRRSGKIPSATIRLRDSLRRDSAATEYVARARHVGRRAQGLGSARGHHRRRARDSV